MNDPGQDAFADDARRYRLDSRIATGGMGQVWRATDTRLGRTVAVKLLKNEYADDETFRSRFASEAQHAAALHHPGVAAVYDFGEAGGDTPRPYLVMELVEGQPLSALITPGRPIDPEVTRDLTAQAAEALGAAHAAGIVHRDVKPANLIVTPDRHVKITDFGIARASEGMALTQTGQVMGTPQYLSPEQAQGNTAGPASDVYSLGVVAFECLTSRRPFTGDTPVATALAHLRDPVPDLPDDVPADLARVVQRALAKDPDGRFPDGAAFAAALRDPATVPMAAPVAAAATAAAPATKVMTSAAPPVPPPPATGTTERRRRDIPWLWILLALAVIAAIIVLVLVAGGDEEPTQDQPDPSPRRSQPAPEETSSTPPPDEPTTEETSEEPTTFDIDEGDYLGRPFPEVEQELKGLGLVVERADVDNDGTQEPETVADVSPTSGLTEGDTVTVSVWKQVTGPPDDPGNSGEGGGNSNSGEGNGNSNGNSGEGDD